MDSRQQLRILWKARWWLALAAVVAALTAYFVSNLASPTYRGEALAQIVPAQQTGAPPLSTDQLLQTTNFYAELARTRRVLEEAQASRRFEDPLFDQVSVEAQPDLLILEFTGEAPDPVLAAQYANAYASAFRANVTRLGERERQEVLAEPEERARDIRERLRALGPADPETAALNGELTALQNRLAEERLSRPTSVRLIQPAIPSREPASPKPLRNALLALLLALVLGTAIVLLRHAVGDRYTSAEEAALDLRLPVLGDLPKGKLDDARSIEAFRKVRAQLDFASGERRTLLVTSPESGAGKSHVSGGLSRAFASEGRRVIAIDGDLRRPTLHGILQVSLNPGLAEALARGRAEDAELSVREASLPPAARERGGALGILPAGGPTEETAELLSSQAMAQVAEALGERYDTMIIDSPPLLAIVDAVVLSRYASGVVLVVDARRSRRRNVRRAAAMLRSVDAPVLGLVFNRSRIVEKDYGYYGPSAQPSVAGKATADGPLRA